LELFESLYHFDDLISSLDPDKIFNPKMKTEPETPELTESKNTLRLWYQWNLKMKNMNISPVNPLLHNNKLLNEIHI
jgi:hypothetical protein